MKALYVLYQRPYRSPDCNVKWLIGRPKCWASLADPRASLIMVMKYLSGGQISEFIYQQITWDVLFQMRYGSLLNSNKQPSDSLWAEATPVFSSLPYCCFLLFCFLFLAQLLWGLPTSLFILVCHSVTPWSISSYNISCERGLKYLSYGLKFLMIINHILILWLNS